MYLEFTFPIINKLDKCHPTVSRYYSVHKLKDEFANYLPSDAADWTGIPSLYATRDKSTKNPRANTKGLRIILRMVFIETMLVSKWSLDNTVSV